MITVEQHQQAILAAVRPLDRHTVPLSDALGTTLRIAVHAAVDLPLFDNSAMDGFAVRFADVAAASAASRIISWPIMCLPSTGFASSSPRRSPGVRCS